jgi:hypothetical protein
MAPNTATESTLISWHHNFIVQLLSHQRKWLNVGFIGVTIQKKEVALQKPIYLFMIYLIVAVEKQQLLHILSACVCVFVCACVCVASIIHHG